MIAPRAPLRRLVLLRHAKSCWENDALADHARPLKARGIRDCALMAPLLQQRGYCDLPAFASDALRIRQTLQRLGTAATWQKPVQFDAALYCFDADGIWQYLQRLDDAHPALLLAGHNPAFTDFINAACGINVIDNLPTCGIVELLWPQASWRALSPGSARLAGCFYPKLFR